MRNASPLAGKSSHTDERAKTKNKRKMETLGAELGVLGDEASVIQVRERLHGPRPSFLFRSRARANLFQKNNKQEVRGLAEELANLRQETFILQNNFDEVRARRTLLAAVCFPATCTATNEQT